ncbi:MAG TPA: hypothetical protein VK625_24305, partial [Flavitalea sp.]|nr:hypothetical protein [Flavitalea sp.]
MKPNLVCRFAVTVSRQIACEHLSNIFFRRKLLMICFLFLTGIFQAKSQNRALTFNGTAHYVSTTQYLVPTSGDFTVELWVYATAGGLRHFVSQGQASTAFYIGMT